jgi:hypothetical protein
VANSVLKAWSLPPKNSPCVQSPYPSQTQVGPGAEELAVEGMVRGCTLLELHGQEVQGHTSQIRGGVTGPFIAPAADAPSRRKLARVTGRTALRHLSRVHRQDAHSAPEAARPRPRQGHTLAIPL